MPITCKCLVLDAPTKNNHVYPRDVFEKALKKYMSDCKRKYGTLLNASIDIDFNALAYEVLGIHINAFNEVFVDIECLDTPNGLKLKLLLKHEEIANAIDITPVCFGTIIKGVINNMRISHFKIIANLDL